jgi:hypothetical protein
MKKLFLPVLCLLFFTTQAQTPFQRVYTMLNGKCQNSTCHSATATDGSEALKFDGDENAVYTALYNVPATNASSVAKYEKLVKQQHPYSSFLLRKIAGEGFDTDLAIDSVNEGALMKDITGNALTNKEIEFVRQWIMFGAKKTYGNGDPAPNWQLVSDYYDNPAVPFLTKPPKPAAGTGSQFRMGPVFLPTSGQIEQEWLQQLEVNFPYLPEVYQVEGYMNQQSHHFILFKFLDTAAAVNSNAIDKDNMALVSIISNSSFDGDKTITAAWQADDNMTLPQGTAMMWEQKTVLDMNFHMKNYNGTSVLPCDFYFNILYRPRDSATIPMYTRLVNNSGLFILQGTHSVDYDDEDNGLDIPETRYLWNMAGHTHKFGTGFDLYIRDTTGTITDKIYDGTSVTPYKDSYYTSGTYGYWDHNHPPLGYFPTLLPVNFGKHNGQRSGLVARTTWNVTQPFVTFSYQTSGEMQLFYYMYTRTVPDGLTAINDNTRKGIYFQVMPNPMGGSGKLVYTLEKPAQVQASVVDITGKIIASTTAENQESGVHEIALGNNGKLAAGIYFARLNLNGLVYTRKFIVTE